jgi:peptidoglycan/LPS O-acetylase OafA/YrhL
VDSIPTKSTAPDSIWPVLAGTRFFLALIVAGSHLTWFSPGAPLTQFSRMSGLAAVIGFLVISGFSIAHSHSSQPKGYIGRRARRVLPCYILSVLVGAICLIPLGGTLQTPSGAHFESSAWSTVAANLVFLQGFTSGSITTNAVVWSLSLEVFFYALAPLLARISRISLAVVTLASVVIYIASAGRNLDFYSQLRGGMVVPLLGWAWLIGFLAYRFKDRASAGLVVAAVCVIALHQNPHFLTRLWPVTIMVVALALGFGGALRLNARVSKGLSMLGDASYPLYLFHMPVYLFLGGMGFLTGQALLFVAIAAAIAIDQWFDKPLKKLVTSSIRGKTKDAAPASADEREPELSH